MKVLLIGIALTMLWAQVSFATATRASSLLLQSYRDAAWLQSEIDMLVARGYVLFKGSWHSESFLLGKQGIEYVLVRDADSPVYRYAKQENVGDLSLPVEPPARSTPIDLQLISEGRKHEIADGHVGGRPVNKQVVHVDHLLHTPYFIDELSQTKKLEQGWFHYTLQAEDGSYPDTPANIDTLQLITDAKTVELKAANNYRVYRGERESTLYKYVETITINIDNGTTYRHSLILDASRRTISERLSAGTITLPADLKNLTLVQETTVRHEVFNPHHDLEEIVSYVLDLREGNKSDLDITEHDAGDAISYKLQLDDAQNMTITKDGNGDQKIKIHLQLIKGATDK